MELEGLGRKPETHMREPSDRGRVCWNAPCSLWAAGGLGLGRWPRSWDAAAQVQWARRGTRARTAGQPRLLTQRSSRFLRRSRQMQPSGRGTAQPRELASLASLRVFPCAGHKAPQNDMTSFCSILAPSHQLMVTPQLAVVSKQSHQPDGYMLTMAGCHLPYCSIWVRDTRCIIWRVKFWGIIGVRGRLQDSCLTIPLRPYQAYALDLIGNT